MPTEIEYALMSGHAYRTTRDEINWIPAPQGWNPFFHVPNPDTPSFHATSGFEAISFQRGTEIVISYAGTDPGDILGDIAADIGLASGVGSAQLLQAAEYFLQVQAANPTANITFTGHSLGGGLAALMGVFFGKRAVTFDQAPFANSAELNLLTRNVVANLKSDLLARGYSEAALQGLTDFIQLREATGDIPNSSLVDSINVQGEFLFGVPWNILDRIGIPVNIPNSAPGVSGLDLHSHALLTAFIQSIQTAAPQQALHDVTFKLTNLMQMIFASSLYGRSTGTANTTDRNFLERLVQNESANAMVTRFTEDLWKLAQAGGLTIADGPASVTNFLSKTLTAFAMQMYYENTANAANATKELFTDLATAGIGTGGIQFDRADISTSLENAKGYNQYFQDYIYSDSFTNNERQLMLSLLPTLRDWYVQAGLSGMEVTDAHNRGAFMLGGSGDDNLTGGSQADLLVGNGGSDVLLGGAGRDILLGQQGNDVLEGGADGDTLVGGLDNDTLRGGSGLDRYIIGAIDGADQIEDSDSKGVVEFDGKVLLSGLRRTNDPANVFHSADGTITLTKQGNNDVVVTGSGPLTIKSFATGLFGIRLFGEAGYAAATRETFLKTIPDPNNPPPATIQVAFFDEGNNHSNDLEDPLTDGTNNLIHALGGADMIISGAGDDQLYGEGGSDELYGGLGNDRLYGGSENDQLFGDNVAVSTSGGNDFLDGGEGNDLLQGGAGRDLVFGGAGNDNLNGDEFAGDNAGGFEDYLDGGAGDDELHGAAGSDVLIGGLGNDLLIGDTTQLQNGTPEQGGNDSLDGGDGQDQLFGLYGDDLLLGGAGNDLVNGQDGSDVLYGEEGNDTLSGDLRLTSLAGGYDTREWRASGGDDLLVGETGADLLSGGEGNDVLEGGTEDDQLYGDYSTSKVPTSDPLYWTLFSAPGDDGLSGGAGNDVLAGGFGADVLEGGDGTDSLFGGEGDDSIEGGGGNDVLYGEYSFAASEFLSNPFIPAITALSGNDVLDGGDGNDELHGGEGADTLLGGAGDDILVDDESGSAVAGGNDILYGGEGNDVLESWMGDDELHGGGGNDRLTSHEGSGSTALYGDKGDDILNSAHESLGTSDSLLVGGSGNDTYEIDGVGDIVAEAAGEGIDTVGSFISYFLPDAVENLDVRGLPFAGVGNELNNVLTGGSSLEGLGGNDTLIGSGWLDGGTGNDVLQGTGGVAYFNEVEGQRQYLANTYVFAPSSGHDTIQENDATFNSAYYQNEDTILFTTGIAPSDVTWERVGNDLVVNVHGGTDQISIPSYYDLRFDRGGYLVNGVTVPPQGIVSAGSGFPAYVAPSRVELVQFADGMVWDAGHFGAPLLGDFLADSYRFERGSGDISILDFDFWQTNATREQDSILLGADLSASDLTVSRVGEDLALSVNGTTDRLTMQAFFKTVTVTPPFSFSGYTVAAYQIEQVQFADGTVWAVSNLINHISTFIGSAGTDTLFGNLLANVIQGLGGNDFLSGQDGDDVLDGGAGNDRLFGDAGNDTYVFARGGGQDILVSYDPTGTESEVVRLGSDVLPSDVTIQVVGTSNDLVVRINGTSDQLLLDEFLWREDYQIDRLEFGDGTLWDTAMILDHAMGLTLVGTDASNTLRGSMLDDVLDGLGENDLLVGNEGDDRLIGGLGDDELSGDGGDDTYVFGLGDGLDTIYDEVVPGEANLILFGAGIAQGDLVFVRDEAERTLTIQVGGGADQLRLMDFDPTGADGSVVVETLAFADGSTLNLAVLYAPLTNHAPALTAPLADQTVLEDAAFNVVLPGNAFADEDAGDVLTLLASVSDGNALPSWVAFDPNTRTFSGTPDDAQVGSLDLKVTVTDTGGLAASDVFTLTVQNVNEAPTVAAPIANQTTLEDALFSFVVSANTVADEDVGDVLTYSVMLANGNPLSPWLSFNAATRTLSGTPLNSNVGTLNLAVKAMDAGGLDANSTFTLTVQNVNDAPTVSNLIPDQQAAQGTVFSFVVPIDTFADVDVGDTLTYSVRLANGNPLPAWLSFNATTRTLTGTPQAGDVGTIDVRVTAIDTGTLSASDVFALMTASSGGTSGNDVMIGTPGNDLLDGLIGDDTLQGLGGNDTLIGGPGNDLLDGGAGTDAMQGGTGNDTYIVSTGDSVVETANNGLDTVQSNATWTLGANLEVLTLTGTANINGTGNTLDNLLTGNSGANVLTGGAGNDVYIMSTGDTVVEGTGAGTDTVLSDVTTTLGANVELLILIGTNAINGIGNSVANTITGNNAVNILNGGAGADILAGLDGNDTYIVDNAGDVVFEIANNGIDMVQSSVSYALAANVENLTVTSTTAINGTGNGLNNVLTGNSAANTLTGADGTDSLRGNGGNDTLNGGNGNDTFLFGHDEGRDLIQDNSGTADKLLYDAGINPLDLIISRQVNDLRIAIHGTTDQVMIQNWYMGTTNRTEMIQAGNGQTLLSTRVDQLIQAMASFSQQSGLTWDQAINQQPAQVQTVLAASWQ